MSTPGSGFATFLARQSDLLLAGAVVAMVGILIVSIPASVLDVLIGVNISAATVMLMVSLYTPGATRLPSLPTIILLSTLFRLALNVSATRLILLEGDAGRIIEAFGQFAVGGNYVVGGVVFLVLTLIQFLVVAKGAERVAEVGARFTLDAMPGNQNSIEADLRGGLITGEEARARRRALDRESKLYGAIEGAMRFVKGDAIAGIVISAVNIIGGLVVGVLQQDLGFGDAAEKYTLLTIGDGLVAQIPALLFSVSAGIVVTRVAGGNDAESGNLGRDLFAQILENWKGIWVAGVLLVLLGLSGWPKGGTGLPPAPFFGLGFVAIAAAETRRRRGPAQAVSAAGAAGVTAAASGTAAAEASTFEPPAVVLELHEDLEPVIPREGPEKEAIDLLLARIRIDGSGALGFGFPPVSIRYSNRFLKRCEYAIYASDGLLSTGEVSLQHVLVVNRPLDDVARAGFEAQPVLLPGTRRRVARLMTLDAERAVQAGFEVLTPSQVILLHLNRCLRENAAELLTFQESARLLDLTSRRDPDLVQAVKGPNAFTIQQIHEILRALVHDQVPIRNLRGILESLARVPNPREFRSLLPVIERVRRDLSRALCSTYAAGHKILYHYRFSQESEEILSAATDSRGLDVETATLLRQSIARTVNPWNHTARPAVLLVPPSLRAYVQQRLIDPLLRDIVILAEDELTVDVVPTPVGIIALPVQATAAA